MSPELEAALERAREWNRTASPEEKEAMFEAQRKSLRESIRAGNENEDATVCVVPSK